MKTVNAFWDSHYAQGKDFRHTSSQALTKLLGYIDVSLPKAAFDIGCGTGQLTRELYHRGYVCAGVDISSQAIAIAKASTVRDGLTYIQVDFETPDSKNLPAAPYGLITCKLVYVFMRNKPGFLTRVKDLLVSDGSFVVMTPIKTDVPTGQMGIAVDFDQTMVELQGAFAQVETFADEGLTYFVCSNKL